MLQSCHIGLLTTNIIHNNFNNNCIIATSLIILNNITIYNNIAYYALCINSNKFNIILKFITLNTNNGRNDKLLSQCHNTPPQVMNLYFYVSLAEFNRLLLSTYLTISPSSCITFNSSM